MGGISTGKASVAVLIPSLYNNLVAINEIIIQTG
jgi:hypothetical protein